MRWAGRRRRQRGRGSLPSRTWWRRYRAARRRRSRPGRWAAWVVGGGGDEGDDALEKGCEVGHGPSCSRDGAVFTVAIRLAFTVFAHCRKCIRDAAQLSVIWSRCVGASQRASLRLAMRSLVGLSHEGKTKLHCIGERRFGYLTLRQILFSLQKR